MQLESLQEYWLVQVPRTENKYDRVKKGTSHINHFILHTYAWK